jgi:hypothetical protein
MFVHKANNTFAQNLYFVNHLFQKINELDFPQ